MKWSKKSFLLRKEYNNLKENAGKKKQKKKINYALL